MELKEFIIHRTRVALALLVTIFVGIISIVATFYQAWDTVNHGIVTMGGIVGIYNISQGYTKAQLIKKTGTDGDNIKNTKE